jgi:hypothetical protein
MKELSMFNKFGFSRAFFLLVCFFSMKSLDARQFVDDLSLSPQDSTYNEIIGVADAKAHLRLGKIVLLIPGGPPVEWRYNIRVHEYAKFGIEWRLTGDESNSKFEEYRKAFNGIMEQAINVRLGPQMKEKIERAIAEKTEAAARRRRAK